MSAFYGRVATFGPVGSPETNVFTGVRVKNLSILGEAPDITDDDSDGWQEFLAEASRRGITVAVSGLTKDANLINQVAATGVAKLENYCFDLVGVDQSWTGDWIVSGVELGVEENEIVTFSATVQSTGPLSTES